MKNYTFQTYEINSTYLSIKNDYGKRENVNNEELVSHGTNINCVSFGVDKWD